MSSTFESEFLACASGQLDSVFGETVSYTSASGTITSGLTAIRHMAQNNKMGFEDGDFEVMTCKWDIDLAAASISPTIDAYITDSSSNKWVVTGYNNTPARRYMLDTKLAKVFAASDQQYRTNR